MLTLTVDLVDLSVYKIKSQIAGRHVTQRLSKVNRLVLYVACKQYNYS